MIENTNNVNAIDISVTCVAGQTPTTQSYDRAVTKASCLSRINGMLLNCPASTSILYRNKDGRRFTQAGAGLVASGAASFGSAMRLEAGLGGNLGDHRLRPLRRCDAAATGSQHIQFRRASPPARGRAQAQMENDRMALGAGDGGALPLAFESNPPWDLWVEGRYSGF